ncbi:M23 family metallopeptidase [Bacteroides bouchesdurhonensis]|uniref:M23 family metallopeptidase n=1 Tax=Bacteroides bouchesdurhonensis TaxID=1841855 RepID=UPI00097FA5C9|nr:M23 family metallopeptidase [Bacteroides bouchesdurhonensis]
MKNITLLIAILFSISIQAQDKPSFSSMEVNHIRVVTPGLFSQDKSIYLHLDSLKEMGYAFPLPGGKVISAYGARKGHSGADIKTCAKDTIRCAFDGVVRMSKPYSAYGNVVVVRHANGLETIYSHNSQNLVHSGDIVKAGQPIGLTGRTGRATTEHLHFETRINGQHFNPNIIFNLKDGTLRKGSIKCTKNGNGIIVKQNQDNNCIAQNKK